MEKKEGEEDRSTQLRQLKEMSLLSLSHTESEDIDGVIKILKNFFGILFNIKDEYTYSELNNIATASGLDEDTLNRVTDYLNHIKHVLYIKEKTSSTDMEYIKSELIDLIKSIVTENVALEKQIKKNIFSKFQTERKLPKQESPITPNDKKKPLSDPIEKKEKLSKPIIQPLLEEKHESEKLIKKPLLKSSKKLDIEAELVELEKQILKLDNPFVKLELESLKGDITLYNADPNSIKPEDIKNKLETLKGRI